MMMTARQFLQSTVEQPTSGSAADIHLAIRNPYNDDHKTVSPGKAKEGICPPEVTYDTAPPQNNFQFQSTVEQPTSGSIADIHLAIRNPYNDDRKTVSPGKAKEGICPPEVTYDTAPPQNNFWFQSTVEQPTSGSVADIRLAIRNPYNDDRKTVSPGKAKEDICPPEVIYDTAPPQNNFRFQSTVEQPTSGSVADIHLAIRNPYNDDRKTVSPGKAKEGICPPEVTYDTAPPQNNFRFQSTVEQPTSGSVADIHLAIRNPYNDDRKTVSPCKSQLKMYYQNVRGLRTKIDELFVAASDAEHDVIILTETWLNDEINSLQLFGPRYSVYRNDRDPIAAGKKRVVVYL
ncbi:uncharacterized protein LOC131677318 [Topomyia yanbarensis]|uniref:uncharacterized protein LOC131677318 n=1 Tax=Topomyia yanbarensis TaxID=2498891 RepID=UPI00273B6B3D|nr:uncharacterized protein LOC131677318 [Topomyia yanbarensis]